MSRNRRVDEENVVHLHNRVLLSCRKQWHHEIWRQIERTRKKIPNEVTETQKDKYSMYLLISRYWM